MGKVKSATLASDIGGRRSKVPGPLAKSRERKDFIREGAKKPTKFYDDVGIIADPNKTIGLKRKRRAKNKSSTKAEREAGARFLKEFEEKANKAPKKKFKFGKVMSEELDYYINKYADDYVSMSRDKKNIYQDSPGQLRYKILKYLKLKQSS